MAEALREETIERVRRFIANRAATTADFDAAVQDVEDFNHNVGFWLYLDQIDDEVSRGLTEGRDLEQTLETLQDKTLKTKIIKAMRSHGTMGPEKMSFTGMVMLYTVTLQVHEGELIVSGEKKLKRE